MRSPRLLLRGLALAALAALLVGVPLLVFRVIGNPLPSLSRLEQAWSSRRVGGDLVIDIGGSVFVVLWAWFAITAITELWHVLAWRFSGSRTRLAPLPPGPSGWVRSLVRFIALSTVSISAAIGTVVPLSSATAGAPARLTVAAMTTMTTSSATNLPAVDNPTTEATATSADSISGDSVHQATGRDTPYSLANTAGHPELRDRIIELNLGRQTPDGSTWQGGVFPAGMEVVIPHELAVMTPLGPAHEVVSGDSYWRIADDHLSTVLQREPTPQEVLGYTEALVSFNHPLLGHRDPALILPGELVVFTPSPETSTTPEPVLEQPVLEPSAHQHLEVAEVHPQPVAPPLVHAPRAPGPPTPPPIAAPIPRHQTAAPAEQSVLLPYTAGVASALMLSAGALGALQLRRRRQLSAATIGARLTPPTPQQVRTEQLLRSLDASERLARLDLALRAAAPDLAEQGASVLAVLAHDTGEIRLFLRGSAAPRHDGWTLDPHAGTWTLGSHVSLAELAPLARRCGQPCPALVHLGGAEGGGEVFIDLEAVGRLMVRSPHSPLILRSIAASLSVSPFFEGSRLFTVGLDDPVIDAASSEQLDSLDAALDAAAMVLGSTAALARSATTFGLRANGTGGEQWEPAVIVATGAIDGQQALLDARTMVSGSHGLALVVDSDKPANGPPPPSMWELALIDGHHILEPLGLAVQPAGLEATEVAEVRDLLAHAAEVPVVAAPVLPIDHRTAVVAPFVESEWSLLVRIFGPVEVVSHEGVLAVCERSKAVELIVWLSQHRERSTRTAARTALWDLDVRDATFANVVSDARRAMARATPPQEGEEWIARTLTEDLPLHPAVVTDAELLAARVEHARRLAPLDAIEVLRPGVELLGGMPFAGTSYLWTDAEGITSAHSLLALGAAAELAGHCLALGDVEGVFWATGQGLKVFNGHEELIALRMRAHGRRGDLAGVRSEWESYERSLAADPWAASEPAPKLVALRRELLSANRSAEGA